MVANWIAGTTRGVKSVNKTQIKNRLYTFIGGTAEHGKHPAPDHGYYY